MHIKAHTHAYTQTHTYTTYIHAHTHTYIHAHTHARSHADLSKLLQRRQQHSRRCPAPALLSKLDAKGLLMWERAILVAGMPWGKSSHLKNRLVVLPRKGLVEKERGAEGKGRGTRRRKVEQRAGQPLQSIRIDPAHHNHNQR